MLPDLTERRDSYPFLWLQLYHYRETEPSSGSTTRSRCFEVPFALDLRKRLQTLNELVVFHGLADSSRSDKFERIEKIFEKEFLKLKIKSTCLINFKFLVYVNDAITQ